MCDSGKDFRFTYPKEQSKYSAPRSLFLKGSIIQVRSPEDKFFAAAADHPVEPVIVTRRIVHLATVKERSNYGVE